MGKRDRIINIYINVGNEYDESNGEHPTTIVCPRSSLSSTKKKRASSWLSWFWSQEGDEFLMYEMLAYCILVEGKKERGEGKGLSISESPRKYP